MTVSNLNKQSVKVIPSILPRSPMGPSPVKPTERVHMPDHHRNLSSSEVTERLFETAMFSFQGSTDDTSARFISIRSNSLCVEMIVSVRSRIRTTISKKEAENQTTLNRMLAVLGLEPDNDHG